MNAGAQQLLEDMQRGVGDVISKSSFLWVGLLRFCVACLARASVDVCRWACEERELGGEA